jgi:hypothetical protein
MMLVAEAPGLAGWAAVTPARIACQDTSCVLPDEALRDVPGRLRAGASPGRPAPAAAVGAVGTAGSLGHCPST